MSDEREQAWLETILATIAPYLVPAVFTPIEEIAMPEVRRKQVAADHHPHRDGGDVARRLRILRCTLVFQDKAAPGVTFAGSSVAATRPGTAERYRQRRGRHHHHHQRQ